MAVSWYCFRFRVNSRWRLLLRKIVVLRRPPSSSPELSRYSVQLPAIPFLTSILACVNPFPRCTYMPDVAIVAVVAAASVVANFVPLILSVCCCLCAFACFCVHHSGSFRFSLAERCLSIFSTALVTLAAADSWLVR